MGSTFWLLVAEPNDADAQLLGALARLSACEAGQVAKVQFAADAAEALEMLRGRVFDLAVVSRDLPGAWALEPGRLASQSTPVVVMADEPIDTVLGVYCKQAIPDLVHERIMLKHLGQHTPGTA